MAKRFTDSEKWKKVWFTDLSPAHKCLWFYILDSCSTGGVWEANWKLAAFHVGASLDVKEIGVVFQKQFHPLDGGRKWFIRDYITFQYGRLNPHNPAHKGAIEELQRYSLLASDYSISLPDNALNAPSEGLPSTLQGAIDMDKGKAKGKGKGKDKGKAKAEPPPIPEKLNVPEFVTAWERYVRMRKEKHKPITPTTVEADFEELVKFDLATATAMVMQSVRRGWTGIFPLKEDVNGTRNGGAQQASGGFTGRTRGKVYTNDDIARVARGASAPGSGPEEGDGDSTDSA